MAGVCWVLRHTYSDGSGTKNLRVYTNEDRAIEDYELVRSNPADGGSYFLDQVVFFDGTSP